MLTRCVPAAVPAIFEAAGIPEHTHLQHAEAGPRMTRLQARAPLQRRVFPSLELAEDARVLLDPLPDSLNSRMKCMYLLKGDKELFLLH